MNIDGVQIGPNHSAYIIAEAGVNHNGDLEVALDMIKAAASAGADAVKFQTFSAERLVTHDAPAAEYQTEVTGEGSQHDMLKQYELEYDDHHRLIDACREQGITFLSTPFDVESADMLAELGIPAIKVGSGELDNYPLLRHIAELERPMIVSTGMGTMAEVQAARETIRAAAPDGDLALLHCTSAYPCPVDEVNLRAMQTMATTFPEPVGYSDHTVLPEMPGYAVAAGAHIIEKHFTLDSTLPGPDHKTSLEPDGLSQAVDTARTAGRIRGLPVKQPTESEIETRQVTRKSLRASRALDAGTTVTPEKIRIKRPADGLSPQHYDRLLGATVQTAVEEDDPLRADFFQIEFS